MLSISNCPLCLRIPYVYFLKLHTIVLVVLCITSFSCKKQIQVGAPVTSVNEANVYNNDATAAAVLTGIYTNMSNSAFPNGGITSTSLFCGLSADELTLYNAVANTNYIQYYTNSLTSSMGPGYDFWSNIYPIIFVANSAILGLTNSSALTPAVKLQLLGEAKFIRAFCYFYLVNLYGDVPLVLETDYKINSALSRTTKSNVYQQIISDLKEARSLLSENYLDASVTRTTTERVRPTKWAATALLSRAYLYTVDFVNAEVMATEVISHSSSYTLNSLGSVFLKNSNEAIWQLQPVRAGTNTQDAVLFVIPDSGPNPVSFPVYLSSQLGASFEAGDGRKTAWMNSVTANGKIYYFPYKYKANTYGSPVTEYTMVLRLAEQYLIRAEARAQQGNLNGAINDLNVIRTRAGLSNTTASTKTELLSAVLHERQVELFTEWGHRWLDIKRSEIVNGVMSVVTPQKGGSWNSNWQLYPIPLTELEHASNLSQNTGY